MAGAISRPISRSALSWGAHSGRKRQPDRQSDGTWTANCASPPTSVPTAHPRTTCSGGRPIAHRTAPQATVITLKSAGERAGQPKRSSAFSMPIATAAKETRGRNGIMIRVSRIVSAVFPAAPSNPGAIFDTIHGAKTTPRTTSADRTTARNVRTRLARRKAPSRPCSFTARTYVGTKAAERAPSAKRSRRRFGIRKPIRKASEW